MSENTVNAALRRLGNTNDDMTAHGFRAMASTLLNESGKWSSDAIERALAHKDKNAVRAAYHRGAHWAERVDMDDGKKLIERLRMVARTADPAFAEQIIALSATLGEQTAALQDNERELHELTCRLFDLTPEERALVEQGR